MGRREFYAWVKQAHMDRFGASEDSVNSWAAADSDPGWKAMRAKRDREMYGR